MPNISGDIKCANGHTWIYGGAGGPIPDNWLCQCGERSYGDMKRDRARVLLAQELEEKICMSPIIAWLILLAWMATLMLAVMK